jgi:cysteinyl-tRNA synthetase
VERLRNFVRRLHDADGKESGGKMTTFAAKAEVCFGGSMDDDLNIGLALASLFDFVREINNLLILTWYKQEAEIGGLSEFDAVLGVFGKVS